MTSSNGNIFRVTGHLCGEFTGLRWIPAQRPVTRSFNVFVDLRLNKRLSKQSWGWWFETLSRPLWRHCNGMHISWDVQSHYVWWMGVCCEAKLFTRIGFKHHTANSHFYSNSCKTSGNVRAIWPHGVFLIICQTWLSEYIHKDRIGMGFLWISVLRRTTQW